MKREQIIEILEKYKDIESWYFFGQESEHKALINLASPENIADEILALPLDVPSDDEINTTAYDYCMFEGGEEGEPEADPEAYRHFRDGMNCMRDEIIKRNN